MQPLTLAPDPRVKATAAELQKQHDMEMQIVAAMQRASEALQQARGAKNNPQAAQVAGGPGARPGDTFTSLLGLFGNLLEVVDSADAAPTEQAQSTYRDFRQRLDTLLAAWTKAQAAR
jgi:hypothetical protein